MASILCGNYVRRGKAGETHEQAEVDFSGSSADFLLDRHLSEHRIDGSTLANDELSTASSCLAVNHFGGWLYPRIADTHILEDGLVASEVEKVPSGDAQT